MTIDEESIQSMQSFLERAGTGSMAVVTEATGAAKDANFLAVGGVPPPRVFRWPRINLYCPNTHCDGPRYFSARTIETNVQKFQSVFVTYICKNCGETSKTFALFIWADDPAAEPLRVLKVGEHPALDEKVSSRLLSLVGKDRDLFLKGRRAERAGLGIGAFSYYRRVVENQKDEILVRIAEAATALGHEAVAAEVQAARSNTQFSEAINSIKHVLPESLLVGGNDPLRVLHRALSNGLHNKDDAHCLDYAETIREVLAGLAERIARAKQDEEKLRKSIGRLMREGKE